MTGSETLMARAALWGWAARAFAYPTAERERAFFEPAERDRLAALATSANPDGTVSAALRAVWAALDTPDDRGEIGLAEEHTFLFGRHVRVPPYESSYVLEPGTDRSTHLAEIGGLYAAFGLTISAAHPDMPDHLGAECELLAVLLAKEAYALARGWSSRAKLARGAHRKLVVEHLQRWLPAFSERLEKHRRRALYPALAALLLALLAVEERQLGAPRPAAAPAGAGSGRP
jgi:TorA maturation chaperone TorD